MIPNAASRPDLLVSTYNNQIAVTMAVLSSCFSPEAAERFLDSFVENLQGGKTTEGIPLYAQTQFFNASIVDELAHLMEKPHNTSLTQGWTFALEGEVDSGAIREALDACLALYPKLKCTMTREYPSLKRAFRYCWAYREDVTSTEIFREIEDLNPDQAGRDILSCYTDCHASHYIDITRQPPIKVLLMRQAGGRSNLFFFVHHAGVDGIGFLIFFQSFIRFYEDCVYGRKKNPAAYRTLKVFPNRTYPFNGNISCHSASICA